MTKTMTDVTDLSDAAFDVFLAVKSGEECVDVDHLSHAERISVCEALGVPVPRSWKYYSDAETRPAAAGCREGAILARQDRFFED